MILMFMAHKHILLQGLESWKCFVNRSDNEWANVGVEELWSPGNADKSLDKGGDTVCGSKSESGIGITVLSDDPSRAMPVSDIDHPDGKAALQKYAGWVKDKIK